MCVCGSLAPIHHISGEVLSPDERAAAIDEITALTPLADPEQRSVWTRHSPAQTLAIA